MSCANSKARSSEDRFLDTAIDRFGRTGPDGASTRAFATVLRVTSWTNVDPIGAASIRATARAHTSAMFAGARGDSAP
jgi:hypothetical protein